MTTLFCPTCSAYFPAGPACPHCGGERPRLRIPTAPGQPAWRAEAPGSVAAQLALAHLDGRTVLVVPWGRVPRRGDDRPADGGVSVFDTADGSLLWAASLGAPVEGGAALADLTPSPGGIGLIVGTGTRGVGAGEGGLVALDLRTGQERWRRPLGGAVRAAPVVDGVRVYAAAGDGLLTCLDVRDGKEVWRAAAFGRPTPIPAPPLVVKEKGAFQAVVVATYGGSHGREEGRVVAFDGWGHVLWEREAGGNVRGAPVAAQGRLFVAAFRDNPSAGALTALDARTGRPVWPQPFTVEAQPGERGSCHLSAAPLVHAGTLYVGSLNHRLYALDAATGTVRWERAVGGGIAVAPAWIEGLVIVGANDGKLYALDGETGEPAWEFPLGASHVLTDPLAWEGFVFAGAADGALAALPWHLGRYGWAAARLEGAQRFAEAGDCRALAAHFGVLPEAQREDYRRAADDWERAGEPEKAACMWLALDRHAEAAGAFRRAGLRWRMRDPHRGAGHLKRAADLYFALREREALDECTRALASCARLPFVALRAVNVGRFIQWEEGEFTLRLVNEGATAIPGGVRLWLGGALKSPVQAEIRAPWNRGRPGTSH